MSDLKCPFCQQELEEETFARGRVFVSCNNPNCIISDWGGCSKQIITELIRTRKALDVAEDALIGIEEGADDLYIAQVTAEDAIEEIHKITHGGKDG